MPGAYRSEVQNVIQEQNLNEMVSCTSDDRASIGDCTVLRVAAGSSHEKKSFVRLGESGMSSPIET